MTLFSTCTQWEWIPLDTCTPCFGVCRCVMSDEKRLLEEEEEEIKVVELLKNESSTMEGEQMAEEKPTVEKSDRCELISYNTSLLYQWWGCTYIALWWSVMCTAGCTGTNTLYQSAIPSWFPYMSRCHAIIGVSLSKPTLVRLHCTCDTVCMFAEATYVL